MLLAPNITGWYLESAEIQRYGGRLLTLWCDL